MLAWEALVGRKCLSVVFDLRFCDGLRASFVGLRDPSIGLRSPCFVVLCQPERTVFRSEMRALFRPRRASVGLKGFYVGLRGLCIGQRNSFACLSAFFRSNVTLHGLREPSICLRGPSTDRENPVATLRWHSVGLKGPSVDLRKTM